MSPWFFGVLSGSLLPLSSLVLLLGLVWLGFQGVRLIVWSTYLIVALWLLGFNPWLSIPIWALYLLLNLRPLRMQLLTKPLMSFIKKLGILPEISETEKVALDAGTTWMDKELFSGFPDFKKIRAEGYEKHSGEAKDFVDTKVEQLCGKISDWEIHTQGDLSAEAWKFIKDEKLLGMIIPKEYGGLGMSAIGNSEVVAKLSSRSLPLCLCVMVPNSLGPAELLVHYGTKSQKDYYLPRLARGEEIPCFALTEPHAGSDAGSISSEAVVFKGEDGQLYIRINWEKRYITLAAIATLIGLAVKLKDPDELLGKGTKDLGITCVLIPAQTPGIQKKQRHNPLGVPFYNGPTVGQNVVVSINQIIGGAEGAGRGWQMLMECLAAGRSISLPAQCTGGAKLALRAVSAYTNIRKQFGIPIGKFEGIEEPFARVAGYTYILEAMRIFTAGAVDKGMKPSVVSAIAKYQATEISRKVINDAMDILGGAGISRGPRNLLATAYIGAPISITVEGANILTRSMIIYGQGAIRCHPYAYQEMTALSEGHLDRFDAAFWGHVGYGLRNASRALLLFVSRGHLAAAPSGQSKRYFQKLSWASANFAVLSDLALASYGGSLKFKEKITGRFADVLSWMYLITSCLRRFEAEGHRVDHLPYLEWAMHHGFGQIQEAFDGILANMDAPPGVRGIMRGPLRFLFRINRFMGPSTDRLGAKMAEGLSAPGELRDSLTQGIYIPKSTKEALGRYEEAFVLSFQAAEVQKLLNDAMKRKVIPKDRSVKGIEAAVKAGVISSEQAAVLTKAEELRADAVQVDSYDLEQYATHLLKTS